MTAPGRPALYEWECREVLGRTDQDVGFWRELVAGGRPVLELACGTGRVTLPLAATGVPVVGLDNDRQMLAVATARRGEQRWPLLLAADMRRFALASRFAAVIVPYNSIQLLTDPSEAAACLACAAAHLAVGGILGLEVTDFQRGALDTEVADQSIHVGRIGGQPVHLSGSLSHDLGNRTSTYRRRFTGPDWSVEDEVSMRSYSRDELASLLARVELKPGSWWAEGRMIRVVAGLGGPQSGCHKSARW